MSNTDSLKAKLRRNLPAIAVYTGIVTVAALSIYAAVKQGNENAAFVDDLNTGLEDGSLTALVDIETGVIDIVETASLNV